MNIFVSIAGLIAILGMAGIAIRCLDRRNILAALLFLMLSVTGLFALSNILEGIPKDCPFCGHANNTSFCTNCGACLEEKAPCLNCGSEINRDEFYCGDCGVKTYFP